MLHFLHPSVGWTPGPCHDVLTFLAIGVTGMSKAEDSLDGSILSVKGIEGHFLAVISHWGSPWIYGQLIAFDLVWPSFSITALLQWSLKQLYQNHLVHWDLCVSLVKFHPTDLGPSQSQRYFWISSLSLAIIHLHFASLIMLIRPGLVTESWEAPGSLLLGPPTINQHSAGSRS